ncbi:aldehyde dehydrogenase family protein [Acidomonas methanolica]|uniref:Aldehyde dehydrogenase domain-containing protein n=1 Tax=Acidomonas methanolica NBRC 104435 TaxID=1231351 RepID=A0A023D8I2_ACIMT|nr:aldehyde dehydrogenase family protein [Acidomonas methanolica]MBU2653474.1 aldehyde dehydrogenase family protein [Acidomonas methanolica]TCS32428.1 aldehyde dehydrogenase family protein [Acidomonas methanolica]GAJ30030.1 hypothetical protein Amme_099_015 [Acidomonas methanolica NBRC 104435]GBQ54731.1 hypothetical protein AA0498_2161 [Acidomonas methanolica]GEK97863.1 hypothetical protein AME01nite_03620 [Acidomonas methanolica NBRC 104435]
MSSTELHPGTASFSLNPATGERFARHDPLSDADLERVLARTAQAAGRWKDSSHVERQSLLRRFGAALRTARDGLAEEATRNGQADRSGAGGGRKMRRALRLVCGPSPAPPGR